MVTGVIVPPRSARLGAGLPRGLAPEDVAVVSAAAICSGP